MDYKSNILEIGSKIKLEDALTVDKVSNYVGIGTTSPAQKLEVYDGNIKLTDGTRSLLIGEEGGSSYQINSSGYLIVDATSGIQINKTTSGNVTIASGNVGIGTTSPTTALDIRKNLSTAQIDVSNSNLRIVDSTPGSAAGQGGAISLSGSYSSTTILEGSPYIKASKANSDNGDYGYGLEFGVRASGSASNNAAMVIDSSSKVGIGTTSPLGRLQVNEYTVASQGNQNVHGELSVFANSGDESLFLGIKNAAYPNRGWAFNPVTSGVNSNLQIKEHGSTGVRMTIQTGGNVGIGTTSPATKLAIQTSNEAISVGQTSYNYTNKPIGLQIAGWDATYTNAAGVKFHRWTGSATDYNTAYVGQVYNGSEFVLAFRTDFTTSLQDAQSDRMVITSAGNVGIGTTSPTRPLSVYRSTAGSVANFLHYTDATAFAGLYINVDNANDIVELNASGDTASTMAFQTGNAEKMRITSGGNVGIGTTSPTSTLHIDGIQANTGTTSVSNPTGTLRLGYAGGEVQNNFGASLVFTQEWFNGSSAQVAMGQIAGYKQSGDGNYGGGLTFWTANENTNALAERVRIDKSGNVGIGTTSPGATLDVVSSINGINAVVENDTHNAIVQILASFNAKNSELWFGDGADSDVGKIDYDHANNSMAFTTNAGEHMRITSAGNVGIGTTTPTAPLHIEGGTTNQVLKVEADTSPYIRWVANGTDVGYLQFSSGLAYLSNMSDGDFRFRTNNTDKMTITSGGNVGIGTTVPSYALDIERQTGEVAIQLQARDDSSNTAIYFGDNSDADAGSLIYNQGSNYMSFTTNAGERMRINSSGNVGINETNPLQKLHVGGAVYSTGGYFTPSATTAYFTNYNSTAGMIVTSSDDTEFISGGYSTMKLSANGTVGIRRGVAAPGAMLDVNGGIRMGDDTAAASSTNVGTLRYRADANNSYVDMCMQTGASTYTWVNIKTNTW